MPFYEDIAANYDEMTGFASRLGRAEGLVRELLRRHPAASAVDVACGTGVYALALARCGVRTVVGTDISEPMLDAARRHARDLAVTVGWRAASMQDLHGRLDAPADLVLCLGNSLPHLLTPADLAAAMASFRQSLVPGGVLVLHLLNYTRILDRQERIVEINRRGDVEYVRFYDLEPGPTVRFNLLALRWQGEACTHELHSTVLYPYRRGDLTAALQVHGFAAVECHGGLDLRPFAEAESDVLLVLARRAG